MKKYLYIFRHAPYGNSLGQEGLDALLVASAFESIKVIALFLGDGVYQIKDQQNHRLGLKLYTKTFSALQDFGVENIYVHSNALQQRGLSEKDLSIGVNLLSDEQVGELFHQQHRMFGF